MPQRNKKGQVAVLDLFISAMIFGILVTVIMVTWNNYNTKIENQIDYNTELVKSFHLTDLLTKYPGKPSAWEHIVEGDDIKISILGLAKDDRVIDPVKLQEFLSFDYNETKQIMRITSYDYYFRLYKLDGSDFTPKIEKGVILNDTSTIALTRFVIYNETEAILEFRLQD